MKINFIGDRTIQLNNNLISGIEPKNFNEMLDDIGRSSISLDLSSNQISTLKTGTLRDLENSWIGLTDNKIYLTESDAIRNVSFISIFFLKLAANVSFANDTFHVRIFEFRVFFPDKANRI